MKKTIFTAIIIFICASAFSQVVNVGSAPGAGDGDKLRDAMIKVNNKFYGVDDSLTTQRADIQKVNDSITILRSYYNLMRDSLNAHTRALYGNSINPTYATLVHSWTFEQNVLDQTGSLDGTASAGLTYLSLDPGNGSFVASFNGTDKYITYPYLDFTNSFSISFDYRSSGFNEAYRVILTNDSIADGFSVIQNPTDGRMYFRTIYNGDTITARSDSVYQSSVILHYAITVNKSAGRANIYAQGVDRTDVTYISTGFRTAGTMKMGQDFASNGFAYAYVDNPLIYTGELTPADALDEYQKSEYFVAQSADTVAIKMLNGAVEDATPAVVALNFSENIDTTDVSSVLSSFVLTQDAAPVTINSFSISSAFGSGSGSVYLHVNTLTGGTSVLLSYTAPVSGGIQDTAGNVLASFSDSVITNNIVDQTYSTFAFWPFNDNWNDSISTYDGAAVGSPTFEHTIKKSGSASLNLTAIGTGISIGSVDVGNIWTVVAWVYLPSGPSLALRPIIANTTGGATNDGYAIYISTYGTDDRKVIVQTGNGSSYLYAATGTGVVPSDTWTQIAVIVNKTAGTAQIRVNNVNQTVSGNIRQDFATLGTTYLGCRNTSSRLAGYLDQEQIYTEALDSTSIEWLKNNPGSTLSGTPDVPVDPTGKTILFKVDYDSDPLGQYQQSDFLAEWDLYPAKDGYLWNNRRDSCFIVDVAGNRCMKATFPPTGVGPDEGGLQWNPGIPGQDELYFSFNVYLAPNWVWGHGGKFPGVGGNPDTYTGGISKPGYTDGFQCALMWGYGYGGQDDIGTPYFYLYHQDQSGLYGDLKRWGSLGQLHLPTGEWFNLTVRFVMNTIKSGGGGNYDGIMEGFYNGTLVAQYTGLRFRNYANIDIDFSKIETFFGGSGSLYAPGVYTYQYWDDFIVWKYAAGENVPRGNVASPAGRVIVPPNYPR